MRIKQHQVEIIKDAARQAFGEGSRVYLFGSRADDSKKGGDIDLYVETGTENNLLDKKLKMLSLLHAHLGEQKIDLVINNFTKSRLIYEVARREGVLL